MGEVLYTGHLIHLIKDEKMGCRIRSRFWLGDVDGVTSIEMRTKGVPEFLPNGLCQHATEEMSILAGMSLDLYKQHSKQQSKLA